MGILRRWLYPPKSSKTSILEHLQSSHHLNNLDIQFGTIKRQTTQNLNGIIARMKRHEELLKELTLDDRIKHVQALKAALSSWVAI